MMKTTHSDGPGDGMATDRRRISTRPLAAAALALAVAVPLLVTEPANAVPRRVHADFDGDGYADLVVGIPKWDRKRNARGIGYRDMGAVQVIYGGRKGLTRHDQRFTLGRGLPWRGVDGEQVSLGVSFAVGFFDNDRFADLAIGSAGSGSDAGTNQQVRILYGSPDGLRRKHRHLFVFVNNTDEEDGDYYVGRALAAGDFDGDGTDDLVTSGRFQEIQWTEDPPPRYGRLHLFLGGRRGLRHRGASGPNLAGHLDDPGTALAVGDFDGDGADDIAAGDLLRDVAGVADAGAVLILHGRRGGPVDLVPDQQIDATTLGVTPDAEQHLGRSLASADFDANGYDDLAIGAPGTKGTGMVHTVPGSAQGLVAARARRWTQAKKGIKGAARRGDGFGYALAAGRLDGGRAADLAVGIPFKGRNVGHVSVLYGKAGVGITARDQLWHQGHKRVPGARKAGDQFGTAVSIAHYGRSPHGDLAIGVIGEDAGRANAGAVNVIYGTARGLRGPGAQRWHANARGIKGVAQKGSWFGAALVDAALPCPRLGHSGGLDATPAHGSCEGPGWDW